MISAVQTPFTGIWPALLTPLTETLDVDIPKFAAHCRALLEAGCSGVTPFGTTGEGPSFSVAERKAAIDGLIAQGVPAERILVSTSCAALPDVVELTRHALAVGTHGCLMLPPFFLKGVGDDGIIDAYRYVFDRVADARLRVYLYHIPQVSGVALSHRVIRALQDQYPQTIVGIKDSGCQRDASLKLADAFMPRVMVYVGNEPDLQALGARGSTGAVSGVANIMPRLVQRLVGRFDAPQAAQDQQRVMRLLDILGGYGLTAALKGVMALLHDDPAWMRVRPPLVALSGNEYQLLAAQIQNYRIDRAAD
ncbi:MAG TPA: dihydrodipicolinate synthase family protein [Burkholderiaceae bacterium]